MLHVRPLSAYSHSQDQAQKGAENDTCWADLCKEVSCQSGDGAGSDYNSFRHFLIQGRLVIVGPQRVSDEPDRDGDAEREEKGSHDDSQQVSAIGRSSRFSRCSILHEGDGFKSPIIETAKQLVHSLFLIRQCSRSLACLAQLIPCRFFYLDV